MRSTFRWDAGLLGTVIFGGVIQEWVHHFAEHRLGQCAHLAVYDPRMDRYVPLVGSLVSRLLGEELLRKADELFAEMDTPEWLFANDRRGHLCYPDDAENPGRPDPCDRGEERRAPE